MDLKVIERVSGGVTILDITGRLTNDGSSKCLKEMIKDTLLSKNRIHILLNMEHVSYLDASGIADLTTIYSAVNKAGGKVKFLNFQQKVYDLLAITKLITVFDEFNNETEAINSFGFA